MTNDPPLLSGTAPGLVDPSQPSRLLRTPSSCLFFAEFDPLTARANGLPNLSSLHIDATKSPGRDEPSNIARSNGKRIVIETDPEGGSCTWRFVPRAKVDAELLGEEGPFPRLVELCGRIVRMTQDQWDIYKLDPEYDCVVRVLPSLTTITRTMATDQCDTPRRTPAPMDNNTPTPEAKQDSPPAHPGYGIPRERTYKSMDIERTLTSLTSETDRMAVDGDSFYAPPPQAHHVNVPDVLAGKKRRRGHNRSQEMNASEAAGPKGTTRGRRESFVSTDPSSRPFPCRRGVSDISNNEAPTKKSRTRSPGAVRRELQQKRLNRERKRKAHLEARFKLRRDGMHRAFWDGLGIPPALHDPGLQQGFNDWVDTEESEDSEDEVDNGCTAPSDSSTDDEEEESDRLARIEESKRKLAELEKDKPLWEESARMRRAREMEAEQLRQREKLMREEEERERQHMEAARRQREEKRELERLEREREARMREQSKRMFIHAPRVLLWTFRHALERYLTTSATFDATKFSAGAKPVTFAAIPWPVLHSSISIQDIEWDAVEVFFEKVEVLLSPEEFKELVGKSQRRFHPDRWRSRGLLASVQDDMERDLLDVAGSTVAQAITPLWKDITGR
ncbi:hypothetical protein JB92DRAFT_2796827 [Gautieria morchelliformis]|nr:hypothetical protein JB92DRAFT_2796827 [Gautieria morchelliformis]